MNKIDKINDDTSVIHTDVGVYAVSIKANSDNWQNIMSFDSRVNWETEPSIVLGKKIVPYGMNNDLPVLIRKIMDENNLAPGIIERQIGLLYGEGPALYELKMNEGVLEREYKSDPEVDAWLKSWNLRRYVDMAMNEYKHMKGFFVRRYINRGARIFLPSRITKLEVVTNKDARLEWPTKGRRLEDVTHILEGDFENNCYSTGITRYPVYDSAAPFKYGVSMSYHNSYSFARNFYSVPSYYGTLKWIMRSSDIPDILKYLTDNGIAVAFHIHSPVRYWEDKKKALEDAHPEFEDAKIDKLLEELKDQLFQKISTVLAGKKNAGKFIETVDFYDDDGNPQSWKIEAIDQKIKDFIKAQIEIGNKADSATTSGMGLHPSLSNIIVGGQLSSGSQMLYAMKMYLAADTSIPEEVIFEPINQAIEANFPGKGLKIGFYHKVIKTEDSIPSADRMKNNV